MRLLSTIRHIQHRSWFDRKGYPYNPALDQLAHKSQSGRHSVAVAAGILLSRLVGLVRDRVFAHYFGNSDAANGLFQSDGFADQRWQLQNVSPRSLDATDGSETDPRLCGNHLDE